LEQARLRSCIRIQDGRGMKSVHWNVMPIFMLYPPFWAMF
jgi:hypothetical protein